MWLECVAAMFRCAAVKMLDLASLFNVTDQDEYQKYQQGFARGRIVAPDGSEWVPAARPLKHRRDAVDIHWMLIVHIGTEAAGWVKTPTAGAVLGRIWGRAKIPGVHGASVFDVSAYDSADGPGRLVVVSLHC